MCGHYAHPVLRTPLVGCGAWQTSQAMTRTGQTRAYPVRHCERGNPVAWTTFPTPTRLPRFARNDQGKGARNYGLNTSGYASAEQTIAIGSLSKSDWLLWRTVCGEINRPIRRRQSARRCNCPTGKLRLQWRGRHSGGRQWNGISALLAGAPTNRQQGCISPVPWA